ncbi:MAG: glycoside hydrolase family 127 protein, partial [Clostridia bacterium]|nr:glycoside hydrolase family 127 protein [Clostridia bacterium]
MSILAACQKAPEDTSSKTTTTGTNPTTTTTTEAPPKTEPPQTDPPKTDEPVTPDQFSPADLSNLLIWYDASTLELEDGDRVDRLENLASKDGKYPAVATVSRNVPTYKAESDISNKPGLVLNKQSSMKVEGSEGFTFDDFTILTVIRAKTVAGNNDHNQIFSKLANSGPWNHQWYFNINGASRMNSGWKDTNGAYMDFGSAAGDLSTNTNYILASSKQGKTSQLYINGTNVGALTSSVTTVAKNDQAVYIGSNGSTSQSMDGTVCEILLLEGEVTTTEIFNLLSYLAEKWSIPMDTSGFLPEGLKLTVAVGGDEIREFSLRQTSYKRTLAYGTKSAPEVTAAATVDGKAVDCKVTQADSASGTATIALTDYDVSYTVKFSVLDRATVSLTPADVTEVKLLDGFWKDKVEMFASTTIHTSLDRFVQQGCLRNFEKVTRGSGSPENNPWLDGLLFETIAAAGDFLKVYDDPALKARVDDYIDVVYNASMSSKNGFLSTHAMLQKPGQYFDDHGQGVWYHECYNFGCMAEAAVHYYEATGEIKLLYVAARFAEFIADNYGYGKINMVPSHSLTE